MSTRVKGLVFVMLSAVFFGFLPFLVNSVYARGGTVFTTTFFRFLLAIPFLYIYLRIRKIPLRINRQEFLSLLLLSVIGYGGTTVLLSAAYNYIPSGIATTIHYIYPMAVIVGSMIFLREKVRFLKIFCALLCTAGIVLFYSGGDGGQIRAAGLILALCSGLTYAFYTLFLSRCNLKDINTYKVIFYMNIIGSGFLMIVNCAAGTFTGAMEPSAWIFLLITALGTGFVGTNFYQRGVHMIGPQTATIFSTFEPLTSMIVGVLIYHESFTLSGALGCALILASVVIVAFIRD